MLDLPAKKGLKQCGAVKDRIEKRSLRYFTRVRNGYLTLAAGQPNRIKIIKVDKNKNKTQQEIREVVNKFLIKIYRQHSIPYVVKKYQRAR
jgi:thymidylate kinase